MVSCYVFYFFLKFSFTTFYVLEPIAKDRKTVVCPFIDVVDYDTFAYRAQDEGARGSFDWELYYKRLPLLPEDLEKPSEPFKYVIIFNILRQRFPYYEFCMVF